jgi:hypothetical protein
LSPVLFNFVAGAIATALFLLVPILGSVETSLGSTGTAVAGATQHLVLPIIRSTSAQILSLSPWVFGLGIAALFLSVNRRLLIFSLITALGVGTTNPYTHRVLYLLPYLILGLSGAFEFVTRRASQHPTQGKAGLLMVFLFITWSSSVTLGARTWNSWRQREARSPDRIMEVAHATVGAQAAAVYTPCYEFYYAGRRLGWKLFHLFDYGGGPERDSPAFPEVLRKVQYVIVPSAEADDAHLNPALRTAGFVLSQRIRASTAAGSRPSTSDKTRISATGFGEYAFFVRKQVDSTALP